MTFFMTPVQAIGGEEGNVWDGLDQALIVDDNAAVMAHLAAGQCVYYVEDHTPEGLVICEHPSGCRELISIDEAGELHVVRSL